MVERGGRGCVQIQPLLIETAGWRPRLFQPQLIECICTRLHDNHWFVLRLVPSEYNDKASSRCSPSLVEVEQDNVEFDVFFLRGWLIGSLGGVPLCILYFLDLLLLCDEHNVTAVLFRT